MLPFPSPRPGFVCGPITHCARARATGPRVPGHTANTPNTKCTVHDLQNSRHMNILLRSSWPSLQLLQLISFVFHPFPSIVG